MNAFDAQLERLARLVEKHTPAEGINLTAIEGLGSYKSSERSSRLPAMDIPGIAVVVQGRKICHVGEAVHDYHAGAVIAGIYPIPVEVEVTEASPEQPYLVAGVELNMHRIAEVMLRMDRIEAISAKSVASFASNHFELELTPKLLDTLVRTFEVLDDPNDAAMLGSSLVDEIYYRALSGERGADLRRLLEQRGEIQRISTAVDYIHKNIDKPVSVDGLASLVHMSRTAFYNNFKEVMHVSPLQYAKSVKLFEAQRRIQAGERVNEAGYQVGYNSPAQFSREYKRLFGYSPSATVMAM